MLVSLARVFRAFCLCLISCFAASATSIAAPKSVALPSLQDNTISPRIIYLENPRFPRLSKSDLTSVIETAAGLVQEHFGITLRPPSSIRILDIDETFAALVPKARQRLKDRIGDFRNDSVDWKVVKKFLIEQIQSHKDSLDDQIDFARPYLTRPLASKEVGAFGDAVIDTFKTRLSHWTKAELPDGHPIIGSVPGRKDLPLNEYIYWALMAKLGVKAEIILTNQLVASVEYMPTHIHTAIRGGITGGSTEYNPRSNIRASVWVSLAPFLMQDAQVRELRNGRTYSKEEALEYAGVLLAHELGHLLLHLGHPWSNEACLMRPAEVLDFAAWKKKLNAQKCRLGSDPEMTPGVLRIPIW